MLPTIINEVDLCVYRGGHVKRWQLSSQQVDSAAMLPDEAFLRTSPGLHVIG